MKWIIELLARCSGAGWVWEKLDGNKTRIAAIAGFLSGVAGLIQEFLGVEGKHDFMSLLTFLKDLPQDTQWLMIVGSLGLLGLGHKLEKVSAALPQPSAPPAPQP